MQEIYYIIRKKRYKIEAIFKISINSLSQPEFSTTLSKLCAYNIICWQADIYSVKPNQLIYFTTIYKMYGSRISKLFKSAQYQNLFRQLPNNRSASNHTLSGNEGCRHVKGLVVGLYEPEIPTEPPKLSISGERLDEKLNGKIMAMIQRADMCGKSHECKIFSNIHDEYGSVAVVGLGLETSGYCEIECMDDGRENVRIAAGIGARKLDEQGCTNIFMDPMEYPEQAAEGGALSIWKYQDNVTQRFKCEPTLELFESSEIEPWNKGLIKAEAQNRVRRLSEMPANQLTPMTFAQDAVDALCPCGVNVEVRTHEWIETNKMTGFQAIAKSSCQPAAFLEMKYCGTVAEEKPIVLIGQGLTYNSGGVCMKHGKNLSDYRACMAGGAMVVAVMRAAAALGLPLNITGLVPLSENMPSGLVARPDDIVKCANGKLVSIQDTGEAGVLMLADAIVYAQNNLKPKLILDVGTTAEDIGRSLGCSAAGVFTISQYLWDELFKAGTITGDRAWRMPLWDYFTQKTAVSSKFDVSNRGYGLAGACKTAAILREFIPCMDWVHLEIYGVGMVNHNDIYSYLKKGRMTGRPTRMLIQFLQQLSYPD